MNASEYSAYVSSVERFLSINRCLPGLNGAIDPEAEGEFSWRPCDVCNRRQGGNRRAYVFNTATEPIYGNVCSDCEYFLAYGQLDDLTMMEMEESKARAHDPAMLKALATMQR